MPCLVGCETDYFCGQIQRPLDGDIISPYVKLFFGDPENPEITVGNESSPIWDNTAVIKSMQYGCSTVQGGCGFKVEIADQLGGAFHLFAGKLSKCMEKSKDEYTMGLEYGWIIIDCDGNKKRQSSPLMYFVPLHLDVNFLADGVVKFTINGLDLMQPVFASRADDIHGDDDLKIPLKTAIRKLCSTGAPQFDVQFARKEQDGTVTEFSFKPDEGGMEGPRDVWHDDGQNKLATIQKWIEPFRTDRDKGIIACWEPRERGNPKLILLEDPQLGCNQSDDPCYSVVGTYIVGGGNCSPVYSFTPSLSYIQGWASLTTGGNSGTASSGETVVKEKECEVQDEFAGILQSIPPSSSSWNIHGPKRTTKETQTSQSAHVKANLLVNGSITAEMRIQGDIREIYAIPLLMQAKFISLIVINPYSILGEGNDGCGDWLSQPACNQVFSNRKWRITGADHHIKEGSFVTTLSLTLDAPGIVIDKSEPFGGAGSNGYVPTNTC